VESEAICSGRKDAVAAEIDGFEFWSLQAGPELAEGDSFPEGTMILEDPSCRNSIKALAIKISQLDLVITVDTLEAHLAGALGVPAWLLLQHEADWRWLHEVDNSPWYPSLRLFRQRKAGDWQSAIGATKDALWNWSRAANRDGLVA
jgi:ADP-heptose:LPS heptosyltransferase